jgi:hypothetical protein
MIYQKEAVTAGAYWKMVAENITKGLGPKTVGRKVHMLPSKRS